MNSVNKNRRTFLKYTALLGAVPFVSALSDKSTLLAAGVKNFSTTLVTDGEVITAAHWGVLKVTMKNGKVVSSTKALNVNNLENPLQTVTADLINNTRIKAPMVRKSYLENPINPKPELRGMDEWVEVSFDKAIKLTADALKRAKQKGKHNIYAGSYGWQSPGKLHNARTLMQRFMTMSGGFVGGLGDYSTGASQVILPHVIGTIEVYEQQTSWPIVLEKSDIVVIWGANPFVTLRLAWSATDGGGLKYLDELRKSGKRVVFIDPVYNDTAEFLKISKENWITPRPNTDVAMMLGMAYHLYNTKNYSKEFLDTYTTGFDQFLPYLLGKSDKTPKTPEWAEKICGVDAEIIKSLAIDFYKNRTMFMSGWAMQRQQHGEQPHWMLVTLASMIGQIGLPGGGFGLSYHYANGGNPTCNAPILGGITLGEMDKNLPQWMQTGSDVSIPVARIADCLLNPGATLNYNGKIIKYPKIEVVYWVGGNPIVHQQQTAKMLKAFRKPNCVIVHDPYWTPSARMADIVFPINTSYERNDLTMTGDYSNANIVPMKQLVKPQFKSVSDYDVFVALSKEFGLEKQYTEGKTEMQWLESFYKTAQNQAKDKFVEMPSFEQFWKDNQPLTFFPTAEGEAYVRYADFIEDPILNALGTPSGKIEIFSEAIAKMNYKGCKGHPTWFEPIEWLGMQNKPAAFAMVSPHHTFRLHSQLSNTSLREKYAISGREPVWINTKDAAKLGIKTGDVVRLFNARGQTLAGANVSDEIIEGVVKLQEGGWYNPANPKDANPLCLNGCANTLTIDIPSSELADANIAHTALVNVEKYTKDAPKVNIFEEVVPVKVIK